MADIEDTFEVEVECTAPEPTFSTAHTGLSIEDRDPAIPFVSIEHGDKSKTTADSSGASIAMGNKSKAQVPRYGVAYSAGRGGTASAGASGTALSKSNGISQTGDGGVSVAHHWGDASCGHHGVAYCQNPGPTNLGAVRGYTGAVLMMVYVRNSKAHSKIARVGASSDGILIKPGVWYTLDPANNYAWKQR